MKTTQLSPLFQAFLAALLFGASAPLAKILLGDVEPVTLAGLLYLGSGLVILGIKFIQPALGAPADNEAQIKPGDLPWLAGAVLAGGVAAPIILLFSLEYTPAATASLLLNFESVSTTLIAALAFKEAVSRRAWGAILLITLSSAFLSLTPGASWGFSLSALGILGACFLWGLDNNFTRNISAKDPLTIVAVKGLAAGSFSLGLAFVLGNRLPPPGAILSAMLLGSLSYGLSIVLFIRAMRGLGAARTSALFSSAPLAGMLLSFFLFRELPGWAFLAALPLMAAGTWLLVSEEHGHLHRHPGLVHEHAHSHNDGHHDHIHPGMPVRQHSHAHTHVPVAHVHQHMPDIHHRHEHEEE